MQLECVCYIIMKEKGKDKRREKGIEEIKCYNKKRREKEKGGRRKERRRHYVLITIAFRGKLDAFYSKFENMDVISEYLDQSLSCSLHDDDVDEKNEEDQLLSAVMDEVGCSIGQSYCPAPPRVSLLSLHSRLHSPLSSSPFLSLLSPSPLCTLFPLPLILILSLITSSFCSHRRPLLLMSLMKISHGG